MGSCCDCGCRYSHCGHVPASWGSHYHGGAKLNESETDEGWGCGFGCPNESGDGGRGCGSDCERYYGEGGCGFCCDHHEHSLGCDEEGREVQKAHRGNEGVTENASGNDRRGHQGRTDHHARHHSHHHHALQGHTQVEGGHGRRGNRRHAAKAPYGEERANEEDGTKSSRRLRLRRGDEGMASDGEGTVTACEGMVNARRIESVDGERVNELEVAV